MGKPTGFLEIERHDRGYEEPEARIRNYREFVQPLPEDRGRPAGGALHGLRHSVLPPGLPGQQPDPGLERSGLSRPLARGAGDPALHQQLPGIHRPHLPGALRGRLHAEHRRRPRSPSRPSSAQIVDRGWEEGWIMPQIAAAQDRQAVAVVGSGPAGLACAQQLARAGHAVTLFEKNDRIGGLLRYGIPDFKMEKHLIDRRMAQMEAEGVEFRTGVEVGVRRLRRRAAGAITMPWCCRAAPSSRATWMRRAASCDGIHFAMDFLTQQNKRIAGDPEDKAAPNGTITGQGQACRRDRRRRHRLGLHRHLEPPGRGLSVTQLEIMPQPPEKENKALTWPDWPLKLRTSSQPGRGLRARLVGRHQARSSARTARSRPWNACGWSGRWATAAR